MKVVVLTGPESTGKSWLAAGLQERFGGLRVDEYVRWFIEQNPRDTCLDDIPAIARGQLQWEDQARTQQPLQGARQHHAHAQQAHRRQGVGQQ